MRVKTSELIGTQLDWAVAKTIEPGSFWTSAEHLATFKPSIYWSQGGLIIELEMISLQPTWDGEHAGWEAKSPTRNGHYFSLATGPTPLIAAMRCYVTINFGDIVDVPDELK